MRRCCTSCHRSVGTRCKVLCVHGLPSEVRRAEEVRLQWYTAFAHSGGDLQITWERRYITCAEFSFVLFGTEPQGTSRSLRGGSLPVSRVGNMFFERDFAARLLR